MWEHSAWEFLKGRGDKMQWHANSAIHQLDASKMLGVAALTLWGCAEEAVQ